jgi:Ca2+-binding RTX toxin-like protein
MMTVAIDLAGGGAVLAWQTFAGVFFERYDANLDPLGSPTEVVGSAAAWVSAKPLDSGGFAIVWDASATSPAMAQDYDTSGVPVGSAYTIAVPPIAAAGYTSLADTFASASDGTESSTVVLPDDGYVTASFSSVGGQYLEQIQHYDAAGHAIGPAFTEQPEIASAFGDNQVAVLADGSYVVSYLHQSSWTSEFDAEKFAADGTHLGTIAVTKFDFTGDFTYFPEVLQQSVAGLPDGGFVVSWSAQDNAPPQVFSEEFNAAGAAVGPAQLLGAAAGPANPEIDAFPDGRYTISWTSPSGLESATFSEQGAPTVAGNNDTIETAAANYTLPLGPHDVILIGATAQTVTANDLGDTITSNDYGSTVIGGSGNDTLIAGPGADMLTGGGAADTFVFGALPWNAGQITDFVPGTDKIDLSALLTSAGYSGTDPVADGYVAILADGQGDTRLYFDPHNPADPWPTLITTLDHVAPTGLTAANVLGDPASSDSAGSTGGGSTGGGSTGGGSPSSVATSDANNYVVPAGVTDVVLAGTAAQTVTANNLGDTIVSNYYGSTIIGGSGNDTLIAGPGADMLTGSGGNDAFVFNVLPWNAGRIADFNPSVDTLNLSGIFASIGYNGGNPVADGYLTFASDGAGNTQLIVAPQGPATTIPILVTTLEHLLPGAIHQGDYIFT